MLPSTIAGILALAVASAEAGFYSSGLGGAMRVHTPHRRAALTAAFGKRSLTTIPEKRCKVKGPSPTSSSKPQQTSPSGGGGNNGGGGGGGGSGGGGGGNNGGNSGGVISINDPQCGPSGATSHTTQSGGPNGAETFLNCGVNTSKGWTPPKITLDNVVFVSLADALQDSNSPFHACSAYTSYFEQYAKANGLPDIMLAAIALQESSCQANSVGSGSTQGLMQISTDKCPDGHGGSACQDPETNIKIGAEYLAGQISDNGGNVALAIGIYNGWFEGMTVGDAESQRYGCCLCQQNLDYLEQFFNGWMQNIDAYANNLGTYRNLDVCN